jgi:uncharacterized membrane protein HdeD (DUF308 family)
MSQPPIPSPFESLRSPNLAGAIDPWTFYIAEGAALVALGVVAMIVPALSSLVIEMFVGWLFLVGGAFRIATVFKRRKAPGFWWSLISAVIAVTLGVMLIAFPLSGMLSLTLALMIMFIVEGVMSILTALDFRKHASNWALLLISGLIDLVLAYMIFHAWPGSGIWFVGLLVGVHMIFTGMSVAFTALAARNALLGEESKEQSSGPAASSGDMPKGAAPTT